MNKAVLIALIQGKSHPEETQEHLDELAFLAETAGITSLKQFVQKLPHPDGRTFLGKGKLDEVRNFIFDHAIDIAIFDDDLSPSQLRNLEKEFNPESRET